MKRICAAFLFVLALASCGGHAEPTPGADDYIDEIMEWRAQRLASLKKPTGFLNQTGLFWLKEGSYRFGAGPDNDIVFPGDAAAEIGVFDVSGEGVQMTVNAGVEVLHSEQPVERLFMADDRSDDPVMVTHRSLAWSVVERDGRFAVRLRDFDHPFVREFGPLPYYDVDRSLRLPARLKRFDKPRVANVGTVIEGLGYHPVSPGTVSFEIGGDAYELEAYESGDRLFFVFGDATNRDATYGAGRFLYAEAPGDGGVTYLDFNKAYSPPCAFNDFSTCPVASPRNRLPVRIEAGEKYDPALHYSASAGH